MFKGGIAPALIELFHLSAVYSSLNDNVEVLSLE
jgi:hypothetical protein